MCAAASLSGVTMMALACSSSGASGRPDGSSSFDGGSPDGGAVVAFEPVSPFVYVAKEPPPISGASGPLPGSR